MMISPDEEQVGERFPVLISPFLRRRILEGSLSSEAASQYIPSGKELLITDGFGVDPVNESKDRVSPALIRTHRNRAVLLVTNSCLSYCRFCFRKHQVGQKDEQIQSETISSGIDYLRTTTEICDVLISGGDPLVLSDQFLFEIINNLDKIDHIKAVRLHTRAFALAPSRITHSLAEGLGKSGKVWIYHHFNHTEDLRHPDVHAAINIVKSYGINQLNQSVILNGVNSNTTTINELMLDLYAIGVVPYNLYVFDRVEGAAHFESSCENIIEIFVGLQDLPGPARPSLVIVSKENKKMRFNFNTESDRELLKDALINR